MSGDTTNPSRNAPEDPQVRNAIAEGIRTVKGSVDTYDVDAFLGCLEGRGVTLTWEATW